MPDSLLDYTAHKTTVQCVNVLHRRRGLQRFRCFRAKCFCLVLCSRSKVKYHSLYRILCTIVQYICCSPPFLKESSSQKSASIQSNIQKNASGHRCIKRCGQIFSISPSLSASLSPFHLSLVSLLGAAIPLEPNPSC